MSHPLRLAALTSISVLLMSCVSGSVVTTDFTPPAIARANIADAQIRCPQATLTNDDPQLQEAFRLAMADACQVLESAEFRQRVEASNLARMCPSFFFSRHRLIPGADIYRSLVAGMPERFTVTAESLPRSTVAITTAASSSMRIELWKLTRWVSGGRSDRAGTVNTLVHEMTHLLRDQSDGSYFQDGWQAAPWCDADRLVSYNLGDAAAVQWTRAHPSN